MDLLSYVILATNNNGNSRCCNRRSTRSYCNSYIIHAAAVLVILLSWVDVSFTLPSDIQQHPKLIAPVNSKLNVQIPPVVVKSEISKEESERELQSPVDISKDILKDGKGNDKLLPEAKGLFFGEDANGVPIVIGTWFRYGSYTLAFTMFGTAFLVACAASAIYYVLFVVTEPSQQVRSLENEDAWNVGRVLRALQLAYETYETFEPYSPVCQLKTVCEIQESGHFQGTILKRLSHYLIHTDVVQKKMANAAELHLADSIGNDPKERCTEKFSECRFSLSKLYEKYMTM